MKSLTAQLALCIIHHGLIPPLCLYTYSALHDLKMVRYGVFGRHLCIEVAKNYITVLHLLNLTNKPQIQQADVVYYEPYYYDPAPLSAGAIAGIIIAVIVFLLLALWIAWCCCLAASGRSQIPQNPARALSPTQSRKETISFIPSVPSDKATGS